MKNIGYFILIITALLSMHSCRTHSVMSTRKVDNSAQALDSVFYYDECYEYKIRRDDKVSISVWNNDDLGVGSSYGIYNSNEVYGKWLMVDAAGNIEVPRIGTMHVENMTITDLKYTIKSIVGEWVKNPIVDIKILNREITVIGEVRDPQILLVDKENNSLLEIISRCKGFEFYADIEYVKVLRQVGPDVYVANIDLTDTENYNRRNIHLHPGDVVIIPSEKFKNFDKRISTIIPFTTTITAAAILMGAF